MIHGPILKSCAGSLKNNFFPRHLLGVHILAFSAASSSVPPELALWRAALPKAHWVPLAEGNVSALAVDAFQRAAVADQAVQAKVARIERMMNVSGVGREIPKL